MRLDGAPAAAALTHPVPRRLADEGPVVRRGAAAARRAAVALLILYSEIQQPLV